MRSAMGSYYACTGAGAGYRRDFPIAAKPTACYAPVG